MLIFRRTPELSIRILISKSNLRCFSNDYDSSSDDEKKPKKKQKSNLSAEKEESASDRLNRLLASMHTDDKWITEKQNSVSMARPGDGNKKRREAAKQEMATKDVVAAAKNIASMLSNGEENKKQTESELLAKLLGNNVHNDVSTENTSADSASQESELNLSDLIVGMKIDRSPQPKEQTRGEYVRHTLAKKSKAIPRPFDSNRESAKKQVKRSAETYTGSVNLFGCEPLGVFKQPDTLFDSPDILTTWSQLHSRELKLQVTHPPSNYFEKIANWTEQGRVWRFPIDNEQDMNEEVDVDFSEHIFLDQHLEPWCPTKGPIRHFMELVCVGLSKNPYITAREKKEHILWYRDYFEAKKDILKDLMSKEKMDKITGGQHLEN